MAEITQRERSREDREFVHCADKGYACQSIKKEHLTERLRAVQCAVFLPTVASGFLFGGHLRGRGTVGGWAVPRLLPSPIPRHVEAH